MIIEIALGIVLGVILLYLLPFLFGLLLIVILIFLKYNIREYSPIPLQTIISSNLSKYFRIFIDIKCCRRNTLMPHQGL